MKLKLIESNLCCYLISLFFTNICVITAEKYKNTRFATIFEDHLIVPHLLPTHPDELCTIIFEPGLIITPGQPYYKYQVQGLPEIVWEFKSDKYYTIVALGAIQKEARRPTTISVLANDTDYTLKPPQEWWHHYVSIDVRKNNLNSGTIIQPWNVDKNALEPNETHKLVYAFAIFEQPKKLNLRVGDGENSPKSLLERYFTPLSKYVQSFEQTALIGGNFFYAVFKPDRLVLDSSPVRNLILQAIKNRGPL